MLRSPGTEPSFAAALGAFVWSASGNAFGGPDLLDGLRSLAVVEAAERSAASGSAEADRLAAALAAPRALVTSRRALMRILLVNDYATATAGAERITRDLRDGFRARGHEVRVFASRAQLIAGESFADADCFGTNTRLQTLTSTRESLGGARARARAARSSARRRAGADVPLAALAGDPAACCAACPPSTGR